MTPNTSGAFSAAARLPIGSAPGRSIAMRQDEPAATMPPPRRFGSRPALTSDDFPQPDVPTIVRKR